MLNKVGTVVGVCIALALGANVYALILINGAVSLITSVLKFIVFKRKSKLAIQWSYFDKKEVKNIFSFSMWTFGYSLAQKMRLTLVPAILGIFSNSSEIAIFAMAMSLEGMVYTLSSAINGLFLPTVSRLVFHQGRKEILGLMIRVGRIQFYIIALIFSGFVIFGHSFLHLWVGEEFSNVYWVLLLLILSNLVSLTQRIADDLVYVENRIKDTAIRILICSALGFGLACLLSPHYGAIGAAIGTSIGLCVFLVIINMFYYNVLELDICRFFKECHLKLLPLLLVFSVIAYYVAHLFVLDSWLKLLVALTVYTMVYGLLCYFALFNKDETAIIKNNTITIHK